MNRFSNKRVLLGTLTVLILVAITGLVLRAGLEERREAVVRTRVKISAQVDEISDQQQRLVSKAYQLLFTLSHLSQVRALDGEACTTIFANLLKQSGDYTVFLAATPEGGVFADSPALDSIKILGSAYEDFMKAGNLTLGGFQIGLVRGKPTVLVAYPVLQGEDRLRAILVAGISLEWLSQIIDLGGFLSGGTITVLDRTGTIRFHHPDSEHILDKSLAGATLIKTILQKGKGIVEGYGPDNIKRTYGFTSFDNNFGRFYVSLGVPTRVVPAEVTDRMFRNFIWLGIVTLLVLSVTWLFGYLAIKHPLDRVAGVMQQLARGNFAVRTGISQGSLVVRQLAMALDQMADSLQSREAELKTTNEARRGREMRYRRIIEAIDEGVWMIDAKHHTTFANRKAAHLLGYELDEMKGKSFLEFVDKAGRTSLERYMLGPFRGPSRQHDLMMRRKDGTILWAIISQSPFFDEKGSYGGMLMTITDITERKKTEERLKYMSFHDPLTGIYNRAYFEEGMRRLESARFSPVGIIVCDVDGLKFINDTLGHKAGDTVLVAAARIIKECFRESDLVARVGGDEFAILLPNTMKTVAENACHRMRRAILNYNALHTDILVSFSIGCAVNGKKPIRLNSLYTDADHKMYKEKLHNRPNTQREIVQTLMKALEEKDFMTKGHMNRLRVIINTFASALNIPRHLVREMHLLAQFHDIGKVAVSDSILFKPEKLTSEEYTAVKRHCEIGHRIAQFSPSLMSIADLILKHHEWWNGRGYPLGVKGYNIPLECRILGIADAYDSMTSLRPYRNPMSHGEAIKELKKCAGTQFNPDLVQKFVQVMATRTSMPMRRV